MEVGAITESVEVTGEAPVLQTDTTQVGAVISSRSAENTPLISRNPVALDAADGRRYDARSEQLQ